MNSNDAGDILFICGRNSARSKLAEAFALSSGLSASSCGLLPPSTSLKISPHALSTLLLLYNISIPLPPPRSIYDVRGGFDHVILLCDCVESDDENYVKGLSKSNTYSIWTVVKPSHTENGFEIACSQIRGEMEKLGWL
ncbi:hypothetical protein TrVE_jg6069 [Triparma verrucosa]|uniref:Phosphotyrosine protein phosphatase I domain-containing protein n=1 Tax=Triparma verrucosa TaxID=1606542 RepID=A0A9W7BX91_9STRA|nr:hypothetical protein TrVE_jg6069 [Triparma verrucosa]